MRRSVFCSKNDRGLFTILILLLVAILGWGLNYFEKKDAKRIINDIEESDVKEIWFYKTNASNIGMDSFVVSNIDTLREIINFIKVSHENAISKPSGGQSFYFTIKSDQIHYFKLIIGIENSSIALLSDLKHQRSLILLENQSMPPSILALFYNKKWLGRN